MKTLLLIILIVPFSIACEKEQNGGEPVAQYHILNFVDETGTNLFESNQILPSEFLYGTPNSLAPWENWKAAKKRSISVFKQQYEGHSDTAIEVLEENEYLIVENFQGEEVKGISINGVEYTLKLSPLKDGFFLNDKPLEYSTEKLSEESTFYLHNIELVGY